MRSTLTSDVLSPQSVPVQLSDYFYLIQGKVPLAKSIFKIQAQSLWLAPMIYDFLVKFQETKTFQSECAKSEKILILQPLWDCDSVESLFEIGIKKGMPHLYSC